MRVALCISGQPRFFEQGFMEIKKMFLDRYNCDVFLHTWHSDSLVGTKYNSTHSGATNLVGLVEANTPSRLLELYKPTAHQIEEPKKFEHNINFSSENLRDGIQPNNVFSMFYSICRSIELKTAYEKEHNFTYDVVVRLRFDLSFAESFNLEQYPMPLLYVTKSGNPTVYYDIFGFGSSELMNFYGNVFYNIEEAWNLNSHFVGERLLTDGLNVQNVQAHKIDLQVNLIR